MKKAVVVKTRDVMVEANLTRENKKWLVHYKMNIRVSKDENEFKTNHFFLFPPSYKNIYEILWDKRKERANVKLYYSFVYDDVRYFIGDKKGSSNRYHVYAGTSGCYVTNNTGHTSFIEAIAQTLATSEGLKLQGASIAMLIDHFKTNGWGEKNV